MFIFSKVAFSYKVAFCTYLPRKHSVFEIPFYLTNKHFYVLNSVCFLFFFSYILYWFDICSLEEKIKRLFANEIVISTREEECNGRDCNPCFSVILKKISLNIIHWFCMRIKNNTNDKYVILSMLTMHPYIIPHRFYMTWCTPSWLQLQWPVSTKTIQFFYIK